MWLQLLVSAIFAIIGGLLAPKPPRPQDATPQSPDDIPSIEDTEPVAVLFGTRELIRNNVVWYGDLKTDPIKQSSGGK